MKLVKCGNILLSSKQLTTLHTDDFFMKHHLLLMLPSINRYESQKQFNGREICGLLNLWSTFGRTHSREKKYENRSLKKKSTMKTTKSRITRKIHKLKWFSAPFYSILFFLLLSICFSFANVFRWRSSSLFHAESVRLPAWCYQHEKSFALFVFH